MAKVDLVIRNARLVTPGGTVRAGLASKDGKIVAIGSDEMLPPADTVVDAGGSVVTPGGVDVHVHIPVDTNTHRGDFASETAAALAGGTTTVVDFVMRDANRSLLQVFEDTLIKVGRLARCDFGLHAILCEPEDLEVIPRLAAAGVTSFKHIMADCDGIRGMDTGLQLASFRKLASLGAVATVHAESDELQQATIAELKRRGSKDPLSHALSRTVLSEVEAVTRAVLLAEEAGLRLHVFHVSSARACTVIRDAQRRGLRVTGETCPHYLLFTREDIRDKGPYLLVNPSLKGEEDRKALWEALEVGVLHAITSDHWAPLRREKEPGWVDCWKIEGGVPGIQTRCPVVMSEGAAKGRMSLERFVDLVATGPAKIFGLYPRKGALTVGADADAVVWDTQAEYVVTADTLMQTCDWTPYEGWVVSTVPRIVIRRGEVVYDNGRVLARPGSGSFVASRAMPGYEQGAPSGNGTAGVG